MHNDHHILLMLCLHSFFDMLLNAGFLFDVPFGCMAGFLFDGRIGILYYHIVCQCTAGKN